MLKIKLTCVFFGVVLLSGSIIGDSTAPRTGRKIPSRLTLPAGHPEREPGRAEELEELTRRASQSLPASPAGPASEHNFIDALVFQKARKDKVPLAPLCSDAEFLRRVSLDLTGRLPGPEGIREFLKTTIFCSSPA